MNSRLKHLCWLLLLCNQSLFSQSKKVVLPPNWFNLDRVESGYFGISTEKAYLELLKDKKPKQEIIVAVLDGGVDIDFWGILTGLFIAFYTFNDAVAINLTPYRL